MEETIKLFNQDNLKVMKRLEDESIDIICIDPPYLYLKGQKLERPFDEELFFGECKRLLTKKGFIVMFGRGVSFYRWNTILANLGFNFKEEIIWDKRYISSPLKSFSRVHETISIFGKGQEGINLVRVPYLEMKKHDIDSIVKDIKRIKTTLNNTKSFDAVLEFLENNKNEEENPIRTDFTARPKTKFNITGNPKTYKAGCVCVGVVQSMTFGMKEKSIIRQSRDHYTAIHPTQKPVRLLERLLALVVPKDKEPKDVVVADFFGGSMSCMEAVYNMGMQGIATEIDKEYFLAGQQRIKKLISGDLGLKAG